MQKQEQGTCEQRAKNYQGNGTANVASAAMYDNSYRNPKGETSDLIQAKQTAQERGVADQFGFSAFVQVFSNSQDLDPTQFHINGSTPILVQVVDHGTKID